jgi:hypothetical protein
MVLVIREHLPALIAPSRRSARFGSLSAEATRRIPRLATGLEGHRAGSPARCSPNFSLTELPHGARWRLANTRFADWPDDQGEGSAAIAANYPVRQWPTGWMASGEIPGRSVASSEPAKRASRSGHGA